MPADGRVEERSLVAQLLGVVLAELALTRGERLGDRLDTRVTISLGQKKGTVVIDFATIGDLNRILGELGDDGFR